MDERWNAILMATLMVGLIFLAVFAGYNQGYDDGYYNGKISPSVIIGNNTNFNCGGATIVGEIEVDGVNNTIQDCNITTDNDWIIG